ncbi:hypothetical protein BVX98_02185, partial [bacterium F11]
KLSEKLDNWALKGAFIDDAELIKRVSPDKNAKVLIIHGIGNNQFDVFKGEHGKLRNFKNQQSHLLKEGVNKMNLDPDFLENTLSLIGKVDFVANYTGNGIVDIILSGFEKTGWSIASRKIMEPYKNEEYRMVYAHSAGAYIYLNHGHQMKDDYRTFIGAEGNFGGRLKGFDPDTTHFIAFKNDVVPHLAPMENGNGIGVDIAFGRGGALIEKQNAPGDPSPFDLSGNHDYRKYFLVDIHRLQGILNNY